MKRFYSVTSRTIHFEQCNCTIGGRIMLDIKTATTVMTDVNREGFNISLEDAVRMCPITQSVKTTGYTILALQRGDCTILAWVKFDKELGVMVCAVKCQSW